ncbi:coagulation factor VIII-like [Tubulanus polymorphus]|uniref:coagulation factor VIII-like n=1 Tax=Tubulanus polymorphus TaxID=672921 RepID=UPI003DA3FED1
MSHHALDDHFDITDALEGKDHYDNTAERLYLDDPFGWHTYSTDVWVELDFGKTVEINDIVTRGTVHHLGKFWVQEYRLKYKDRGDSWYYVTNEDGSPKLFSANSDPRGEVRHAVYLTATALRLEATKTKRCCFVEFTDPPHVTGMRLKVEGCFTPRERKPCEPNVDLVKATSLSDIKVAHTASDENFDVNDPMRNGKHLNVTAERLYFDDPYGWNTYAAKVWLQLDFHRTAEIHAIVTKGTIHHMGVIWVREYRLKYQKPGNDDRWYDVTDENGNPKIFAGNTDALGEVRHEVRLTTTALRLEATKTKRCCFVQLTDPPHVTGMRLKIEGCFEK